MGGAAGVHEAGIGLHERQQRVEILGLQCALGIAQGALVVTNGQRAIGSEPNLGLDAGKRCDRASMSG